MTPRSICRRITAAVPRIDGWEVVEPNPSEPITLPAATTTLTTIEVLN